MKIKHLLSFGTSLLLSISSLLVITVPKVAAAVVTWDGGGSDNNFSTAANWVGDVAPVDGDSLVFPYDVLMVGCSGDVTLQNNLDAGTVTLSGISFTGEKPTDCFYRPIIEGNDINTSGSILASDSNTSYTIQVNVDIMVTASAVLSSIFSTGALSIGANDVAIVESYFSGGTSGGGTITTSGYNSLAKGGGCSATALPSPFGGDSSGYSGSIVSGNDGFLAITRQTNDIARHASDITAETGSVTVLNLDNGTDMSLDTPITFNGGDVSVQQSITDDCELPTSTKTVTLSGNITFTADTTITLSNANLKFTGIVTGKQFVKVAPGGTGNVIFPDGSESTSTTKIWTINDEADCSNYSFSTNNKVIVNADCSSDIGSNPAFPSEIRATLGGTGKIGHIKILSGGTIAPGLSPGCMSTGNLTFVSGSTYDFELGGTTECSGYDRINVTGTVDLGSGTLNTDIVNDFKPAKDNSFMIISNDGTDAVTGTFDGLAQGATFTVDGAVFAVSYIGGDGNDVVLTVQSVPAAPNTGFKLITANPIVTLIATTLAAGALALIARRFKKLGAK